MMRPRGFSLTELMVAVAIGTLLMLAAVTLLVSASGAYVAHTEAAEVESAGRFALSVIQNAARQTGYVNFDRDDAAGQADPAAPPAITGLDAASLSSDSEGVQQARPPVVNGSDVLALRYGGSGSGEGDGSSTTCAGFSVGAGQDGWSIFYVGLNARGEPELRCKYRGANHWSAEAVVGGVDSFQVLYGLDTDAVPDGQVNRYVNASAITALDAALALDGESDEERARDRLRKTWWKRVASVQVSLVLHGARRTGSLAPDNVLHMFGAAYSAVGGDAGVQLEHAAMPQALRERERRMFSATIMLRNTQH